ncbi:uncharacterized protein HGUI_01611 [Hanseniaspora guilliermondii]|uniref:Alcohol dehydrogenase-like N-terminal domain-containing protein n=1 Tax=Hanseniaspora guilliermondii TaxID=56406 RepID=A0A1L0B381_9ASCO|nr:uncharacterized protein HGUI_01611 [Hanseniaspora guilliermondii]
MSHLKPARGYLSSDPKPLPQAESRLKRQPRPLRMVKYVPTKRLQYFIPIKKFEFNYDHKIKKKLSKNEAIIQIDHVGLNGLDWKIKNGFDYSKETNVLDLNSETCLGTEFSGTIIELADNLDKDLQYEVGRKVMGVYYNVHNGTLESCIKVNLKSHLILPKPVEMSAELASGTMFNLLTVLQMFRNILNRELDTFRANNSNILIIGGSTGTSIMLLKYLNRLVNVKNVTIICSLDGAEMLKQIFFKEWEENNWNFINYYETSSTDELMDLIKTFGKYRYCFDFVGGEQYLSISNDLMKRNGYYISTVGNIESNYSVDVYPETYIESSSNGLLSLASNFWKFYYYRFQFDFTFNKELLLEANDLIQNQDYDNESKSLCCHIGKIFEWQHYEEAFRLLKSQKAKGKIIMKVELF